MQRQNLAQKIGEALSKPVILSYEASKAFDNLDRALDKSVLIESRDEEYSENIKWRLPPVRDRHFGIGIFETGTTRNVKSDVKHSLQLYQYPYGVMVAREKYVTKMLAISEETFYFVYQGDSLVKNHRQAKNLIYQATGVELPSLKSSEFFGPTHEVVTNPIQLLKGPPTRDWKWYREHKLKV